MKKIMILTITVLLSFLTACGNSEEQSSSATQNQTSESSAQTQSESNKETESTKETMSQQESSSVEETTQKPTETEKQTEKPTVKPTQAPTQKPTQAPTVAPTQSATQKPTVSATDSAIKKKITEYYWYSREPMVMEIYVYKFNLDGTYTMVGRILPGPDGFEQYNTNMGKYSINEGKLYFDASHIKRWYEYDTTENSFYDKQEYDGGHYENNLYSSKELVTNFEKVVAEIWK